MGKGNRRHRRIKMVLPVRISGKDSANKPINELAHTLDITPNGARLGAIHSFYRFAAFEHPEHAHTIARLMAPVAR